MLGRPAVAAVLVLAACSRAPDGVRAAPVPRAACAAAVDKLVVTPGPSGTLVVDTLRASCAQDAWTTEAVACIGAPGVLPAAMQSCLAREHPALDTVVAARLRTAFETLMRAAD